MLYLVIGGSGSGKSAFAEDFVTKLHKENGGGALYYIATMHAYDRESDERILRHQAMRSGKGFKTVEKELMLGADCLDIDKDGICLLEDLSNLLANEMYIGHHRERFFQDDTEDVPDIHMQGTLQLLRHIYQLSHGCKHLVIVTNNVFSDGITYDNDTMHYMKQLGYLNTQIGKEAAGIIEVVCGIPVWQKGRETC